jgi:hypothetical protein
MAARASGGTEGGASLRRIPALAAGWAVGDASALPVSPPAFYCVDCGVETAGGKTKGVNDRFTHPGKHGPACPR